MKKYAFFIAFVVVSSSRAADPMNGFFALGNKWGDVAPYGTHPGIDYNIPSGTPIIAATKGMVFRIRDTVSDGTSLLVKNGKHFLSEYAHLSKVLVSDGQMVKRGQLIGLSGVSNNYNKPNYAHLHFAICMIGRGGCKYEDSLDPNTLWLDGKPQCFDPKMDYSGYTQKDITLPIACGDYAKQIQPGKS